MVFFGGSELRAQDTKDVNARSPNSAPMGKKQRKAEKTKEKQKKELNKAIEKGRKRHEKIQTKDVRKRMKKSKRKAAVNRAHEKEFFLKRWFTPGSKKKRR
jgi:hypothetical protein